MAELTQLDFIRRWLLAQLDHGNTDESKAEDLIERIESLDLQIAATPAADLEGLSLKIRRFAELYWPSNDPMPEDCLEHIMLTSILKDTEGRTPTS